MRRLALLVWALVGAVLWTAPVGAHAVLQSTAPADRQVLAAAPPAVVLTFNEPVIPVSTQVLDSNGRVVARDAQTTDTTLRILLPASLPDGTYVASWRVTSVDSHPIAGSVVFAVGPPPASWSEAPASASDSGWRTAFFVVRAAFSAALILAAGGALALVLVRSAPPLHRRLQRFAWVAAALALLVLGVQGAMLKDTPVVDLLRWSTWQLGASTTRGISAAVAVSGLVLLIGGLRWNHRGLIVAGSLVALSSVAFTGHTGTADPRWLAAPMLALHAILAAFWIGSLIPLLHGLERKKETKQLVQRFSTLALIGVPLLLFLGVGLVFRHISTWEMLTQSAYGDLLLTKIALVAILLALAAINKWVLTPRLPRSSDTLVFAIRAEFGIGIAILAVTALLSQTPPPVSEHLHAHDPGHMHGVAAQMESAGHMAEIEITPAAAGRNLIVVRLDLAEPPKDVAIELANPSAGIEPIRRIMAEDNGAYVLEGPELAVSGAWKITLDVLVTDFDKATFETEIPIR